MNTAPSRYWNEKLVMAYLEDAAAIHRRLPPVKVQGYFTLWPDTLIDGWERLYDLLNGKSRLGSPMPPEVTYHEEVMQWLRLLSRNQQQLVWMRANRVPWKILIEEFDGSRATLCRRLNAALHDLVVHLHRRDIQGAYFCRLRNRANGFFPYSETP